MTTRINDKDEEALDRTSPEIEYHSNGVGERLEREKLFGCAKEFIIYEKFFKK